MHQFQIRGNFGTGNFKEKYYIAHGANDPVVHFERNFKFRFPDLAKIGEEIKEGRKFRIYPPYGNISKRVVTNNINRNATQEGIMVFDVPASNAFSQIQDYHNRPGFNGVQAPLVCDPDNCALVFTKCKKDSGGGNPWVFQIDLSPGSAIQLPEALRDSDNLHNLDDIFIVKTKEELMEKLRTFFNGDVFDLCMQGYQGLLVGSVPGFTPPTVAAAPVYAAPVAPVSGLGAPAFNPASLVVTKSPTAGGVAPAPAVAPVVAQTPVYAGVGQPAAPQSVPVAPSEHMANPMAGTGALDLDAAMKFLGKPKTA